MVEELMPDDPLQVAGYELRGRLGAGGMGVVYLSYSRGGQPVALKVIRREYAEDPEFRRRFSREVEAARRVHGPYTAPVLDSNVEGPLPWLASAYVAGPSLAHAVRNHGPLPSGTVLSLVAGVSEALQSIHAAGVIHRDLKPTNVLLALDGPRVIDFGIARSADASALTGTNVRLGTPAYMAPEQVTGRENGPAIDVFSLGLVTFFAATGGHPFGEGEGQALLFRIVSQEPDLGACPERLRPIIETCLAKDPDRRPDLDQVIELCRSNADNGSLDRGAGWWLPPPITAELTSRVPAPAQAAPTRPAQPQQPTVPAEPPSTQAGPRPARPAGASGRQIPADPGQAPPLPPGQTAMPRGQDEPTGMVGRPGRGRSGVMLLIGALTALVIGGAVLLLVTQGLPGSDSGGDEPPARAKEEDGFRLEKDNETMVIPPPSGVGSTFSDCAMAPSTFVDLDRLTVTTGSNHGHYISGDQNLEYMNCGEDGTAEGSGIKLLDGKGVMGKVDERDVSPAKCREAARSANVTNPISIKQIQDGAVLRKGMGLCVETGEKNVVLLWINRVDPQPGNDNLSTYVTSATQWIPATS
ncbi:protein kinase [Spirillospora sp. NBC_00431]